MTNTSANHSPSPESVIDKWRREAAIVPRNDYDRGYIDAKQHCAADLALRELRLSEVAALAGETPAAQAPHIRHPDDRICSCGDLDCAKSEWGGSV